MNLSKLTLILFSFILLIFPNNIIAVDATSSATPTNSFELFWPLTAGKTRADAGYRFKIFKEELRKMFIIDSSARADYQIFLATKRLIEAENLWKRKNNKEATDSLKESYKSISEAKSEIEKSESVSINRKVNMINQLNNIILFTSWNIGKPELEQSVQQGLKKLNSDSRGILEKL